MKPILTNKVEMPKTAQRKFCPAAALMVEEIIKEKPITFKERLWLFLIANGSYCTTPEAKKLPEVQEAIKEHFSRFGACGKNAKRKIIHKVLDGLILDGRICELIQNRVIALYETDYWEDERAHLHWILELAEKLGKNDVPQHIGRREFWKAGLKTVLEKYYGGSPYKAVCAAFPEKNIKPWQKRHKEASGLFDNEINVASAAWWLVRQIEKNPEKHLSFCLSKEERRVLEKYKKEELLSSSTLWVDWRILQRAKEKIKKMTPKTLEDLKRIHFLGRCGLSGLLKMHGVMKVKEIAMRKYKEGYVDENGEILKDKDGNLIKRGENTARV